MLMHGRELRERLVRLCEKMERVESYCNRMDYRLDQIERRLSVIETNMNDPAPKPGWKAQGV